MSDLTLEMLAARLEALEKQFAVHQPTREPRKKDWRRVAGMFTGNEYQKEIDAAGAAIRQSELGPEPEAEGS